MELEQCLGKLPPETLQKLAAQYQLDSADGQLPQQLGKTLLSVAETSLLSTLNDEQLWALKLISLCREGQGLIVEQCHQKLNQTTRKWRRNAGKVVQELMDCGLVHAKRVNYRQLYFIPRELRNALAPQLANDIWERSKQEIPDQSQPESDGMAAIRLLYLFLSYLSKHPVRLTQTGGIFKRAQRDIMDYLGIHEPIPEDGPVPVIYPPSLAMLYYYCRSRRLIENSNGLVAHTPQLREWLASSLAEKFADLFSFWQDAYLQQDGDLETLYGLLRLAPNGNFMHVDALLREMESFSLGQSWQALTARAHRFFFAPLALLGMLDITEFEGHHLCRMNRLGRELQLECPLETTFFVQPDHELLVPKNLDPDLLWELEKIADLAHPDQLMIYRLSKSSIYRALNSGMTIQQIRDFLICSAKHELPQNIISLLDEWGATYGRLQLLDILVLHCEDEQLAKEIRASARLAPFIEGELTKRDLIIKRESHQDLLSALTDEGYMPKA